MVPVAICSGKRRCFFPLLLWTSAFTSFTAIAFRSTWTTISHLHFTTTCPRLVVRHHRTIPSTPSIRRTRYPPTMTTQPTVDFDRSQFDQHIPLVALDIPAKLCTKYTQALKGFVLSRPRVKKIYDGMDNERRTLVLSEDVGNDPSLAALTDEGRDFIAQNDGKVIPFALQLGYEHVTVDHILRTLLPSLVEVPSSFEQVGHIAHLNLRDEALPHKHLIGHVILDKNKPNIRTVVNKLGTIDTEYRTFPMEVIAGEPAFDVVLKESNARFAFNFKDVYWNSRLQMEHHRLVELIQRTAVRRRDGKGSLNSGSGSSSGGSSGSSSSSSSGSSSSSSSGSSSSGSSDLVVADMMAGVGPFAIPLAMPIPPSLTIASGSGGGSSDSNSNRNSSNSNTSNSINCSGASNNSSSSGSSSSHDIKKNKGHKNNNPNPSNSSCPMAAVPPQRGITTHANDLNPASFKYLVANGKGNKCDVGKTLFTYNMCGRDFILTLLQRGTHFDEVIMNLPQNATDFLDVFIGLARRPRETTPVTASVTGTGTGTDAGTGIGTATTATAAASTAALTIEAPTSVTPSTFTFTPTTLPRIHVYAVSTADDPVRDVAVRAAAAMQCDPTLLTAHLPHTPHTPSSSSSSAVDTTTTTTTIPPSTTTTTTSNLPADVDSALCWGHIVRDVAPKKMMVCLTFRLPVEVALAEPLHGLWRDKGGEAGAGAEASAAVSGAVSGAGGSRKRDIDGSIKTH